MLLTATEIISKSWDDYVKNWHDWLVFSLIIFLPSFVLMLAGSFGGFLNMYLPSTTLLTDILIVILTIVSAVFGFWTSLALIHAAIKYFHSKNTSPWKEHFEATFGLVWPSFYTSFFAGIFILIGMIFFFVPGLIFSIWYFFIVYNVIANDERGFKALSSSKKLVQGRWWSVAWRIFVPWFFFGTAMLIIQGVLSGLTAFLPLAGLTYAVVENIVKGICSSVVAPITTLAGINLYFNLRDNPFREKPAILSNEPPTE